MQPSLPPKPTGNGFFPLFTATVLKHVGIPVFLTGLSSAHTFSSGSPAPSYSAPASQHTTRTPSPHAGSTTYRDSNQQTRPLHLPHMRDPPPGALIVRGKPAHDLPARPDDAHLAVRAAQEQAVGAAAQGRDVAAGEEVGVGVGRGRDLCRFEEGEGSPLRLGRRGLAWMPGAG